MVYTYLKFGLVGLALIFALAAYAVKSKRGVLAWAFASAAIGGVAAHYHVFWVTALMSLMVPWALVCATDTLDLSWRSKVGFCLSLAFAAGLCLYPTYIDERFSRPDFDAALSKEQQEELDAKARAGELGWGRFIRSNVPFRLVRGLDLKGGFRVEYSVDVQEAIRDKRDRYYDDLRTTLARSWGFTKEDAFPTPAEADQVNAKVKFEKPRQDVGKIVLTFVSEEDAAKINDAFLTKFKNELTIVRAEDKKVVTFHLKKEVEENERKNAVDQAKDKILRRVDSLGLKEAAVSIRGEDIVVEVPGEDKRQFEEIKEIVSQTARLEFKLLDDDADPFAKFAQGACPGCKEEDIAFRPENAPLGPGKSKTIWYGVIKKRPTENLNDTLKRFKTWMETNVQVPDTHQVVFQKDNEQKEDGTFEDTGWRTFYVLSRAEITGDMIRAASKSPDQSDGGFGRWQVNMEFTPKGADQFERITDTNIQKRFAIILDEKVESAPVIQGKISGGSARITMGRGSSAEQLQSATKLELVLKSGALPAPIEYKGEQQIGPSLGTDAILQGIKGGAFGSLLVFILMVVIYARAGFIANLAVLFNLVLQVATLAMFGASMTLPGIAGLALTIGIAVDANVLINERIRDELRIGKSPRQSVDIGYDRAFSAIVDGHVTTLISGLILFQYGSGPIKGFAVTLIIGMIVSLFTGVVCTRLVFDWVVRWRKVKKLSLG